MVASIYTRNSHLASSESFSELSQRIQNLGVDLQAKIGSLEAHIESSAETNVSYPYRNILG